MHCTGPHRIWQCYLRSWLRSWRLSIYYAMSMHSCIECHATTDSVRHAQLTLPISYIIIISSSSSSSSSSFKEVRSKIMHIYSLALCGQFKDCLSVWRSVEEWSAMSCDGLSLGQSGSLVVTRDLASLTRDSTRESDPIAVTRFSNWVTTPRDSETWVESTW